MNAVTRGRAMLGKKFLTIAFLGTTSVGGALHAEAMTFEFSGMVINVSEAAHSFGGLNLSDSFLAKFVFETTSSDMLPADSANGRYGAISTSLTIPHLNITQSGGVLDVTDGIEFDSLTFASSGSDYQLRAVFSGMPTAISSDAMPAAFPPMNNTHVLNVFAASGDKFAGTITSAVVTPEPTVLAMMLGGLLCIRRPRRLSSEG